MKTYRLFTLLISSIGFFNLQAQYTLTSDDVVFSNGKITDYLNKTEKDIIIPDSFDGEPVVSIGFQAFANSDLSSIQIPSSVKLIEKEAFYNTNLKSFKLPAHHKGYTRFWDNGGLTHLSGDEMYAGDLYFHKEYNMYGIVYPYVFTITYNLDGGIANNPVSYTVEDETILLEEASKEDYVFEGWFTDPDFMNEIKEIPSGSTSDIELYAKFSEGQPSSLLDESTSFLSLYPNPSEKYINAAIDISSLVIINQQGVIVKELKNRDNRFDISNLEAGTYMIYALDESGNRFHTTIVKK